MSDHLNARQVAQLARLVDDGWRFHIAGGQLQVAGTTPAGEAFTGQIDANGALTCAPVDALLRPGYLVVSPR